MIDDFGTTPVASKDDLEKLRAVVENLADWDGNSVGVDYLRASARRALGRPEATEEESAE